MYQKLHFNNIGPARGILELQLRDQLKVWRECKKKEHTPKRIRIMGRRDVRIQIDGWTKEVRF
jgi:hypothetical protein